MDQVPIVVAVAGLPLLSSLVLWRFKPQMLPLLLVVAGVAAFFLTAVYLFASGAVSGAFDCWPSCSLLEYATNLGIVYGGAFLMILGLVAVGNLAALALSSRTGR